MHYKILAVDDDEDILELIKETLQREKFSVITAKDGETCLRKTKDSKPDLIILDMGLPDIPGLDVCKILKQDKLVSHIPIIILTGIKTSSDDIVIGLDEGACDYITKPFDSKVLVSRIKVALRWIEYKGEVEEVIKKAGIEVNINERKVRIKGKVIPLTPTEFDLLFNLIRKSNKTLPYKYLLETVWGYETDIDTHTLGTTIHRIRTKLGKPYSEKIVNVPSLGYKFVE